MDDFREHEGNFHDDDSVTLLGILTLVKLKATRSNAMMAFLVIEDIWGSMEVLVFPQTLSWLSPDCGRPRGSIGWTVKFE